MRLLSFICVDAILADLKADTARGAVDELMQALVEAKAVSKTHQRTLVDAVMRRERKGTTGFGNGVAIPHAKHESVRGVVAAVGRSAGGVEFTALDSRPVHLLFLLLSNPERPEEHLKAMERVFRSIKNDNFRRFLGQAAGREEIVDLLREADEELG
jgi:PTS system fructose-specific IIA component/PTS system nitrogen regulatory IIA component